VAAAGETHLAGPWVSGAIGAADEENRVGVGNQDEGDAALDGVGTLDPQGPAAGEPLSEAGLEWTQ